MEEQHKARLGYVTRVINEIFTKMKKSETIRTQTYIEVFFTERDMPCQELEKQAKAAFPGWKIEVTPPKQYYSEYHHMHDWLNGCIIVTPALSVVSAT